jgi:hypothetical protein
MKKVHMFVVLALLFAAVGSVSAELVTDHGAPFYRTLEEGKAAAAKAGEPALVQFYTEW